VRLLKKIRLALGQWKFISLRKVKDSYLWDEGDEYFYLEWWEGKRRRREIAGQAPSQALEAQWRKRNELLGALVAEGISQAAP